MTTRASGTPRRGPTRRENLVQGVSRILAVLAGALLVTLFLINVGQIVTRPVTGGLIWVNDLSRLLVTWVIMIGASAAVGLREHLVVDLVIERAGPRFQVLCAYVVRVCELGIGFVLLVSGVVVAMGRMNIQYIQLGIPTGYAFLAVPVLGFFMVVFGTLMGIRPPATSTEGPSEAGELE